MNTVLDLVATYAHFTTLWYLGTRNNSGDYDYDIILNKCKAFLLQLISQSLQENKILQDNNYKLNQLTKTLDSNKLEFIFFVHEVNDELVVKIAILDVSKIDDSYSDCNIAENSLTVTLQAGDLFREKP
jgi:hypothetical protein